MSSSLLAARKSSAYETVKTTIIGMTRQMATDFGEHNIRVNTVCPGLIARAPAQRDRGPKGGHLLRGHVPDRPGFVTGQAIAVDDGLTVQLHDDYANKTLAADVRL
jgi:NAD(P)-dependent dehydrogenase (short-subunit alcohol dehydrogenase family)